MGMPIVDYQTIANAQSVELTQLREQNRVLREVLVKCRRELWHCNHQLKAKGATEGYSVTEALRESEAALTATSQEGQHEPVS